MVSKDDEPASDGVGKQDGGGNCRYVASGAGYEHDLQAPKGEDQPR